MHDRWLNLCDRLSPKGPALGADLFDELSLAYARPARAYHSLDHVTACLCVLDEVRSLATKPDTVEWALWLHDAVYDPTRHDNEAQSAELSSTFLRRLEASESLIAAAHAAILATRHTGEPLVGDAALVSDIDMSILASEPDAYDRYTQAIRDEYAFVSDERFVAGRSAFLRSLLARPAIFHLSALRARWESAARGNLERELGRSQRQS